MNFGLGDWTRRAAVGRDSSELPSGDMRNPPLTVTGTAGGAMGSPRAGPLPTRAFSQFGLTPLAGECPGESHAAAAGRADVGVCRAD